MRWQPGETKYVRWGDIAKPAERTTLSAEDAYLLIQRELKLLGSFSAPSLEKMLLIEQFMGHDDPIKWWLTLKTEIPVAISSTHVWLKDYPRSNKTLIPLPPSVREFISQQG